MRNGPTPLDRAVEVVLTAGLTLSGLLLLIGLLWGGTPFLRWGVILLLFTPVARVLVVTVGLARQKDWLFTLISLWILGVLLSSVWLAWHVEQPRARSRGPEAGQETR